MPLAACDDGALLPASQDELDISSISAIELWLDVRCGGPAEIPAQVLQLFDRALTDGRGAPTHGLRELQALCPRGEGGPGEAGRLLDASDGGALVGACVRADTPEAQQSAVSFVGSVAWLFMESAAAPMITAENLLAACDGGPTKIALTVSAAADVGGLAFALERGVDALVVDVAHLADAAKEGRGDALLEALQIARAQRQERAEEAAAATAAPPPSKSVLSGRVGLSVAEVVSVEPGGTADRVCLDFIRLLREGEGCLIGSSAKALALVTAETLSTGFVPPRPFRVNAGPVHAYVLRADGSTCYLAEVAAGDELLAVTADGSARGVTVGRCKVEPRPTVRVDFRDTDDGAIGQIFLQQAETVRLATAESRAPLPVTRLAAADRILVRRTGAGTHVGSAIRGRVEER